MNTPRRGQVMLLTVLIMSAVFLSATVIAGLLMVYQLNQVTSVVSSAQAIFAADAAIERGKFKIFRCNTPSNIEVIAGVPTWDVGSGQNIDLCATITNADPATPSIKSFLNGATYKLTILPTQTVSEDDFVPGTDVSLKASGFSGDSVRAVKSTLSQ